MRHSDEDERPSLELGQARSRPSRAAASSARPRGAPGRAARATARPAIAAFGPDFFFAGLGTFFLALGGGTGLVQRLFGAVGQRLDRAFGLFGLLARRFAECLEALLGLGAELFDAALPGVGQRHGLRFDQASDLAPHFAQRAARMLRGVQQLLGAAREELFRAVVGNAEQ